MNQAVACPRCGSSASGNFCAECGAPLLRRAVCPTCQAPLRADALYCTDCGVPVGAAPRKPRSALLPWVLSGLGLAVFSVMIAVLVQRGSVTRVGEMTMTGGIPGETGGGPPPAGTAANGAGGAAMPSMEELAAMGPRGVADRLFERVMREHEGGDFERAAFFIDMALQAYDAVPPEEIDADARFHVGLLRLLTGASGLAREQADEILSAHPEHLLGLLLAARAADFEGDADAAEAYRARVRAGVEAAGGIPDLPEYQAHRTLIERVLQADGGAGEGGT
ncbi:MAG: zinc ribbon domain-containing protein [Gemmatimonadales bacterium]|nr:zinc ribbon domain-containing protein [Gemmatimonadales bacterium]MYG47929.1 zinc ribbon domain-containing protein [Gemmatimonadales bacterium]MYK02026.1 zinc ribbon domain-containing protein [Candidatus Palauibacter ramosifaciens]